MKVWVERSLSIGNMNLAYSDNYSVPEMGGIVQHTGDFGPPRELAFEYDSFLVQPNALFGNVLPVVFIPTFDPSTVTVISTDIYVADFNQDIKIFGPYYFHLRVQPKNIQTTPLCFFLNQGLQKFC